jgi:hypothetical protein
MALQRRISGLAGVPECLQRGDVLLQPGEGIEQPAMRGGIDQRALVVLAVDLDQQLRRPPSWSARRSPDR